MELAKDQALSNPETAAEVTASPASEEKTSEPALSTSPADGPAAEPTAASIESSLATTEAVGQPSAAPETGEIIPPAASNKVSVGEAGASQPGPILGEIIPHRAAPRTRKAPPIRPEPREEAAPRSRAARYGMLAASVALVICIGAAAGAAGFATMAKLQPEPPKPAPIQKADNGAAEIKALKEQVSQLRASVRTLNDGLTQLRTGTDNAGKAAQGQIARLNETIERLEKAQAEPNARLAKITEALDRLDRRTTPTQVAAAAPETTGSIRQPPPLPPLHPNRPVVEGWSLLDVQNGVALVQSRVGAYEVIVGDEIRGLGRIQDIRRQDGRWVVVTARGLILPSR